MRSVPLGRFATVDEIPKALVFSTWNEASSVTEQLVDGGFAQM
jgi:hypothetical protein